MRGIRHVALRCRHHRETERFYCEVLGYAVEWRPSEDEVYLTSGEDNLALHADRGTDAGAETRVDHVGFLLRRAEDVDAWASYLDAKGIMLDTRPRTHRDGARSFYLRDPEGNRLQFLYHPPIADKGEP